MVKIKVNVKKLGEKTKHFGAKIKGMSKGKKLTTLAVVAGIIAGLAGVLSYQPSREALTTQVEKLPFMEPKEEPLPSEMVVLIKTDAKNFYPLTMLVSSQGEIISVKPIDHMIEVEISSDLYQRLEKNPAFDMEWQKGKEYTPFQTPFRKLLDKYSD